MRNKLLIVFFFCFIFSACVKRVPVNLPLGEKLSESRSADVSKRILAKQQNVNSIKTLYYTTIEHGDTRERFRQLFVFEKPAKFRFELLPTTSAYSLGLLIADGKRSQFVDSDSGKITESESVEDLLYETVRFRADAEELIFSLLGLIPNKYLQGNDLESFSGPDGRLRIFTKNRRFNALISADGQFIEKAQILDEASDKVILEVEYSDFTDRAGHSVPNSVKINFVRDQVLAALKLAHFEINKPVAAKLFEFVGQ